jgi:hypothetical protein
MFSDIDISSEEGREQVFKAIKQIINWAYREASIER